MPTIKIYVQGGVVTDVEGLPDGWTYELIDRDCDLCYEGNCSHECHGKQTDP